MRHREISGFNLKSYLSVSDQKKNALKDAARNRVVLHVSGVRRSFLIGDPLDRRCAVSTTVPRARCAFYLFDDGRTVRGTRSFQFRFRVSCRSIESFPRERFSKIS